jgi:hypothetical protein
MKGMKSTNIVLLLGVFMLAVTACNKKPEEKVPLPLPSIKCTTYAYIRCVYDSLGSRFIEIDTIQKSFPSKESGKENIPGTGLPVYSKRTEQALRWVLLPNAEYTMQTLNTDSSGNFYFNQRVDYAVIRDLFSHSAKSRFRNIPFKIIHTDSLVSNIAEEYMP